MYNATFVICLPCEYSFQTYSKTSPGGYCFLSRHPGCSHSQWPSNLAFESEQRSEQNSFPGATSQAQDGWAHFFVIANLLSLSVLL
jgi:predicted Zn-dependent protease